jgi:hypothetical protein
MNGGYICRHYGKEQHALTYYKEAEDYLLQLMDSAFISGLDSILLQYVTNDLSFISGKKMMN